jgi:hypothetical protein
MSSRARRLRRGQPEFSTYALSAKGELLGTVEVPLGVRPGYDFRGYFHPVRAFSRIWPLIEASERAYDRYYLLYTYDARALRSRGLPSAPGPDVSEALERATLAQDLAQRKVDALGMELTDARGQRLKTGWMHIERTLLEEEVEIYERYPDLCETDPFDEIDAGVDVSPYRLTAHGPEKDPARAASHKKRWGAPWTAERERDLVAAEQAAGETAAAVFGGELQEGDEGDEGDEDGEGGGVPWEEDYEWEGEHPPFEDKLALLQRAAKGHPRDTFAWVLDVAMPRHYDDDEDRDEWVKAVQRARAEGVLEADLAQFLIWKIVMNAHEYRHKTVDPVLVELDHRMDVVAQKYGVEADELGQMAEPPAEWIEIDEAWDAREPRIVGEVLLAAGEAGIEAEMRERPGEFGERMKGWEERVDGAVRTDEEQRRAAG